MKCHFWMECKYVEADACVQVCKEVGILGFVEELFFFFFFFWWNTIECLFSFSLFKFPIIGANFEIKILYPFV